MSWIGYNSLRVLDENSTIHYKNSRLLRLSYNGITSAFQAEEAGSTPVGRSMRGTPNGVPLLVLRREHARTLRRTYYLNSTAPQRGR